MNQNDIIGLLEKKISFKKSFSPKESCHAFRKGKWTSEEDEKLRYYLHLFGERNWKKVSEQMDGRSPIQCLHRWTKILKPGLVKGPWTLEEDKRLIEWVQKEGALKWSRAAHYIPGRSGKQCRERWLNNLNPHLKKSNWTDEEDELIFSLYKKYGSAWSKIAKNFEGRTENSIKNRFYSTIRRLALDRSRQSQENSLIPLKSEDGKDILDPIMEKIRLKNKRKEERQDTVMNTNLEVQSILQELTQNYKNSEIKENFLPIKKEYEEENKFFPNPYENEYDDVNPEKILNNLMAIEKGFNKIQNEALSLEDKRKFSSIESEMKCSENNVNEIFNDFLLEEHCIDQSILQLIRKIKNIECVLMDKMKENFEKDLVLKQEQVDSNDSFHGHEISTKRGFSWNEDPSNLNIKKIKI